MVTANTIVVSKASGIKTDSIFRPTFAERVKRKLSTEAEYGINNIVTY